MTEKKSVVNEGFSADWLFRGALARIGDTVDRFTGRRWTPSSSLATSELVERVKRLLDSEAKQIQGKGTIVPHNIKLKVQWDKFSTDSEDALEKLEHELLTAAADHINDNLYYTKEPLRIEVKPDYFTEGVKLFVSFDTFIDDEHEAQLNVTIPSIDVKGVKTAAVTALPAQPPDRPIFIARFELNGSRRDRRIEFPESGRISIGRTAANDLTIDDASISKIHASAVFDKNGQLLIADTGSTNGTFINGERIPYGKALAVSGDDKVKFGTVEVIFDRVESEPVVADPQTGLSKENTIKIGDMEFSTRTSSPKVETEPPEKTLEIDPAADAMKTAKDDLEK
jgi:pSer/pThr/pTyr-binding forkhead associated (FHA) protein